MENSENKLMIFELDSYEIFGATKLDASNYLKSITNECIDKYSARDSLLTVRELAKDLTSEVESECKAIEAKVDARLEAKFGARSFYTLARKCSNY